MGPDQQRDPPEEPGVSAALDQSELWMSGGFEKFRWGRRGKAGLQSSRESCMGLDLWREALPDLSQHLIPLETGRLPLITILLQLMETQN